MHKSQALINHVALVLDASYSMRGREKAVVQATDEQIKHLAARSEELQQETRVSVYRFAERIECLIFDMDVARLPSTEELYSVLYENTALIDATMKSQKDLETTSVLYGDHAFLTFVLTDGQENWSRKYTKADLKNHLVRSDVNWSLGFLVPDSHGVQYMERLGVLRDSIAIWDTTSASGLNDAVSAIKTATDNFMNNRSRGIRGTRSVFSTGAEAVNKKTVSRNLEPISGYTLLDVHAVGRIDDFVQSSLGRYTKGKAYYQLTKSENIQPQKDIIVVEKATGNAYGGSNARHLIGLPDGEYTRVRPNHNPKYDIFVQSTSYNRKLVAGTRVLVKS